MSSPLNWVRLGEISRRRAWLILVCCGGTAIIWPIEMFGAFRRVAEHRDHIYNASPALFWTWFVMFLFLEAMYLLLALGAYSALHRMRGETTAAARTC
jgi:hypothetical protein